MVREAEKSTGVRGQDMVDETGKTNVAITGVAGTSSPIFWTMVGTDTAPEGLVSNEHVIFGGELDLAAEREARYALEFVEYGSPAVIVVDLRQLTFMDATGLKLLVGAAQRAQAENRRLVALVEGAADDPVRRLL